MQQHWVPGGTSVAPISKSRARKVSAAVLAAITAVLLFVVAAVPAGAMTVTFIRHGESEGNASGFINTTVPGPPLTGDPSDPITADTGWGQANNLSNKLAGQGVDPALFDNLYTSTMIRTQQTATPLATALGKTPIIIGTYDPSQPQSNAGIQEIYAGIFEGSSQLDGLGRIAYGFIPLSWALGLRFIRIPGSEDGNEFDARVDAGLAQMAQSPDTNDDGDINVAAFSHGATIMFWTLMNVDNPNITLYFQHPLENTDSVVVESNGEGGWTLKSWAGTTVDPANYPTQMFVNVRDLIVAPQTAIYNMRLPVLALDGQAIGQAAAQGVNDVAGATVKFARDSVTDTVNAIRGLIPGQAALQSVSTTDAVERKSAVSTSSADAIADATSKVKALTDSVKADAKDRQDKIRADAADATKKLRSAVKDAGDQVKASVKKAEKAAQKFANHTTANRSKAASAKDAA